MSKQLSNGRAEGTARFALYGLSVTLFIAFCGVGAMWVAVRVVPMAGLVLLEAASLGEDAQLVEWTYAYIMPYLVMCGLICAGCFVAARRVLAGLLSASRKLATRFGTWYDKRNGHK